jgi:hypothetical protein
MKDKCAGKTNGEMRGDGVWLVGGIFSDDVSVAVLK